MKILGIDTEHSYSVFSPWEEGFYLVNVGIVSNWNGSEVIWFNHFKKEPTPQGIAVIQKWVDEADLIVAHHMLHDLNILRYYGVDFEGKELHCTQVTDYLLEGQAKVGYSLDAVAERYGIALKLDMVRQMWDAGYDTCDIDGGLLEEYVLDDAEKTLHIYEKQIERAEHHGMMPLVKLQNEFTFCLSDIEMNGMIFDLDVAAELIQNYGSQVAELEDRLRELFGEPLLNISSSRQLSAALFGGVAKLTWTEWVVREYKTKPYSTYKETKLSEEKMLEGAGFVPPKKTETKTKGYYSTNKSALEQLVCRTKTQREIKSLLLERSEIAKTLEMLQGKSEKTGLVSKVQPDGKIRPSMNQTVTATGRLSSSDPNGQNLNKTMKLCFKPTNDLIGEWDLSQIEWRAAAWLSQDETMLYEINHGVDQHAAAAKDLMELKFTDKSDPESKNNRRNAKFFNFRMIYGGTHYGFYLDHKMPDFTKKKWKQIVDDFYKKYNGLEDWHTRNISHVLQFGELQTPTGRIFRFSKVKWEDGVYTYSDRQIKNYPVQGLAGGDILPLFMVILRRGMRKYEFKSKMVLTVHDSVVFDLCSEELPRIVRLCKQIMAGLPMYLEQTFEIEWNCELEGEWADGPSYGETEERDV